MEKINLLFLTLAKIEDINERGIYADLLRTFIKNGHYVTILSPFERRDNKPTTVIDKGNYKIIKVKTFNIQKTNIIEKGLGTLAIESQYLSALKKYDSGIKYDLILYSTPPITFIKIINFIKKRDQAKSYLLLKDIFPQNAVDMGMISKNGLLYKFFRRKEKRLYEISDTIGCMSQANVKYILAKNKNLNPAKVEENPNSIIPFDNSQNLDISRKKFEIPENVTLFLYGGNLGKPQGVDFLLETLKASENNESVFFYIVGNGTEAKRIEKFIVNNNLKNTIFKDRLSKKHFDQLIRICDVGLIFLHPDFEIPNFPSRMLSYLENKMPIIAATDSNTDIGDVIESNNAGVKILSGDLTKMLSAIDLYTNNSVLVKIQGQNGYNLLINSYTTDISYHKIMNRLKHV